MSSLLMKSEYVMYSVWLPLYRKDYKMREREGRSGRGEREREGERRKGRNG